MKLPAWLKRKAGSRPALFLHIQKTAGTSLINLARQHYAGSVISHADYCNALPDQLADVRFVSGHFGYAYARHLMPKRYSFTFLRDPVERLLSFYYFCRSRDPAEYAIFSLAHQHGLPDFITACLDDPFLKMHVWNNQVWQLAYGYTQVDTRTLDDFSPAELLDLAKLHLDEFSHVGFTETFPEDANIVCRALGLPCTGKSRQLPRDNITPQRIALAEQPSGTRAMLGRLTELDRELYDHARALRRAHSRKWWRW